MKSRVGYNQYLLDQITTQILKAHFSSTLLHSGKYGCIFANLLDIQDSLFYFSRKKHIKRPKFVFLTLEWKGNQVQWNIFLHILSLRPTEANLSETQGTSMYIVMVKGKDLVKRIRHGQLCNILTRGYLARMTSNVHIQYIYKITVPHKTQG